MKPKGRYNVGLARRHGVLVVEDNSERGLVDFITIRDDTARRQDLKRRSRRYFADMQREFGPCAHFFFAELAGRRLACALVIRFGERATYLYGGSLDDQREVMAPYLLHHEIMNRMAAAGCTWYDLWGTSPPGQAGHDWAGISTFKRKFGGVDIAHVPTMDCIYDRAAYARFVDTESKPVPTIENANAPEVENASEGSRRPADAWTP
jgi:lipid II:glycine glycyltransferase (peptidoglycan interpeptide bridge formation enzyme)